MNTYEGLYSEAGSFEGEGVSASLAFYDLDARSTTGADHLRCVCLLPAVALRLAPCEHALDVFAEDRAGNVAARRTTFVAYSYRYQWGEPLATSGNGPTLQAGRTIPLRFTVRRADGTPVVDSSVR